VKIVLSDFRNLFLICCAFLLLANSLFADQSSDIRKLEDRIVELEKRVAKLEALLETPSKNEIKYSEKWKNRSLWRKLKVGMSKYQVETLLGEPRKIHGGSTLTWWYYSKKSYSSMVIFNKNGLHEWNEPE
jgi:hypothetical protein